MRQPLNRGMWYELFARDGKHFPVYLAYVQGYYMMILLGMILSGVKHVRRKNNTMICAAQIAVFGLILFLMAWENNPRYIFQFELLFCLIAADGLAHFAPRPAGRGVQSDAAPGRKRE